MLFVCLFFHSVLLRNHALFLFIYYFTVFVFLVVVGQIIMPNTACENPSTLFKFLSDQLPYANLSSVQRKYFNEAKGNQPSAYIVLYYQ